MPALGAKDYDRLLSFIAKAESISGDQPFTPETLVELGNLIEADWVTYSEVDHVRKRLLVCLERPGEEDEEEAEINDEAWELMWEHPVCRQWRASGSFVALRLSDVATRSELRRGRFYEWAFEPWGIEYELKARLASPLWHAKTFAFNRKRGRDFTERDRLVLELLRPHLARLWSAARTRRLLKAALAELESVDERDSRGLALVGGGGEIEFASPPAHRLLREFFADATPGQLPRAVAEWLDDRGGQPLVRRLNGRRLTVERSDDALVFEERRERPKLTEREREVVSWVARGMTNAEIAQLLWLAPSTVRKHLENVYAKLGVSTRTAAVATFLGLVDAEAS